MYGIASNKEASVASSLERLGIEDRRSWNVHFIQRPNDWEMGGVDEFLRTLGSNLPPTVNGDRMWWKLTKNEIFDIHSFYNKLRSPLPIILPWKGVWKVKTPRWISFFVWTAVWDRIFTGDNWGVEGWLLLTDVSCAIVMGRLWIICYFIVVRLIGYRVWCLDLLGFFGSCQDRLWILYLVGGIGLESMCLAFGT